MLFANKIKKHFIFKKEINR